MSSSQTGATIVPKIATRISEVGSFSSAVRGFSVCGVRISEPSSNTAMARPTPEVTMEYNGKGVATQPSERQNGRSYCRRNRANSVPNSRP